MSSHLFPFAAGVVAGFTLYGLGRRLDNWRREDIAGLYRVEVRNAHGQTLRHMNVVGNACTHCGFTGSALKWTSQDTQEPIYDLWNAVQRNPRFVTKRLWIREQDANAAEAGGRGGNMYKCCEHNLAM